MPDAGLTSYPTTVQTQLVGLIELLTALLGQNVHGVYLIDDGVTSPADDDSAPLQLLVVTTRDLRRDMRLGLVQTLLRHSLQPAALDVVVVRAADLTTSHPSLLVQLQFTEAGRPQLARETRGHPWLTWLDGPTGSVDRAALLGRTQRGTLPLLGPPLATLLAPVSTATTSEGERSGTPTGGTSHTPPAQQLTLNEERP